MNKKVLRHLRDFVSSIGVRAFLLKYEDGHRTLYYYTIKVNNKKVLQSPHYENIESCYITMSREHSRMVAALVDAEQSYSHYETAINNFLNGYKLNYYVPG